MIRVIVSAGRVGICRPCSVSVFSTRLGAAAAAGWLVGTVVRSHSLVGAGRDVGWVRRTGRLGVGSLAIERRRRGIGVSGSLVSTTVGGEFSWIIRGIGRVGSNGRRRNVCVHGRRWRISRSRRIARCRCRAIWRYCCWLGSVSKWAGE
jgi:hypothetical protein